MSAKQAKKPGAPIFKVVRIAFLMALIAVAFLLLKKPAPTKASTPSVQELTAAAKSFDTKLLDLQVAHQSGQTGATIALTEDEINGAMERSMGELPAVPPADAGTAGQPVPAASADTTAVSADSPQVTMEGDEVVGQFVTHQYGRDIYVTLRAKLGAENSHLVVHTTGFKIGDLSLPISMVDDMVQKKLNEPENQEKLKLPEFIKDVRIEKGQLVIVEK